MELFQNTKKNYNAFKPATMLKILMITVVSLGFAMSASAMNKMSNDEIALAISDRLINDNGVDGFKIDVEVNDGVVTLTGTVDNILAKERATDIASIVKGVRSIVNEINVEPNMKDYTKLQENIENALILDPATDSWEINAKVNRGNVTLTGTVDSWQEKQLAGEVVKGVDGVVSVDNQLNVRTELNRPDAEIATDIKQSLDWDVLVDDALVNVDVKNGKVDLSGVVGSNAEKRRAVTDAWVSGVYDVNDDNLKVESWARDNRFRATKYVEKSDPDIQQAIYDAFSLDPRVAPFEVNAAVTDGIVTLSGIVDNIKAKRAAERDVDNTLGVWWVKNLLKVRVDQPVNDETLGNNVREALMRDPYIDEPDLHVKVTNGIVKLTGDVDTYFQKAQAEDAVTRVSGVELVNNDIKVDQEHFLLTYNPYVDYNWWDFHDLDWYDIPNNYNLTASDGEIQSDIVNDLWWSPFVNSDDIHVGVENGVAHLTGTVDTWAEREAATENAFKGGAVAVNNDLMVNYGPEFYQP